MGRLMRNGKEYGGGPAGSGHEILNNSGTSMAQESKLQFKGQNVSDDSTNGRTVVTSTIECTQAEYDALAQAGNVLPDVDYYISDTSPVAIDAAHLPYSSTLSTKQAIDAKANTADLAAVATSGSGNDVSYDNTHSVNDMIDELSEKAIGSISKYSQITGGTVDRDSLIKVGNTVFGSARLYSIDIVSLGYFFEIPTGYRPKTNQYVMAYIVVNSTFIPIQAEIRSDGLVYIAYSQGVNTTQVGFAGSWTIV